MSLADQSRDRFGNGSSFSLPARRERKTVTTTLIFGHQTAESIRSSRPCKSYGAVYCDAAFAMSGRFGTRA